MIPSAETPISVGPDGAIRWDRFAAEVEALARALRGADRVANLWSDRHAYLVGLAAATFVGPAVVPPIVIGMTVVTGVSLVAVAGRTASHLWRLDLAAKADERKKKV